MWARSNPGFGPGRPVWAIHFEKEAGWCPLVTCDGHPVSIRKKTKTIFPVSELGCTSAHAFATHCGLRGSQSSVLPVCNHMRTSRRNICPMHSHSSTWAGCQRHQINWEHYFRNWDPQVPQVAAHHMWALPRLSFEICCPDRPSGATFGLPRAHNQALGQSGNRGDLCDVVVL